MSRRRHETSAPSLAPDRLRRILLGVITALLVARPLAAGEDPGRLRHLEATSGQTLNLLWWLTIVAAAIWFARSSRKLRLGVAPLGLMLVAALGAASAAVAPGYRHPAWLIVSEWALLPAIFLVVRELASDDEPTRDSPGGIIAALLASAVSLAGYSIYQAAAPAAGWPSADFPIESISSPQANDAYFGLADWDAPVRGARAVFERSDALAALVLMALPLSAAFAFGSGAWKARVAGLLVPALAAVFVLALRSEQHDQRWAPRAARQAIAVDITRDHALFGVGPGNVELHAPRYVVSTNPERLRVAGDSWTGLSAAAGIGTAMALLLTVIATVRLLFRRGDSAAPPSPPQGAPRWEFYLGGVGGLLLGLALRFNDLPVNVVAGSVTQKLVLHAGIAAAARALLWFGAFAIFDGAAESARGRRLAIAVGLAAVAAYGVVSPALLSPAIAQIFWALAALGLAGPVDAPPQTGRSFRWVAIPVACAWTAAYYLLIWEPAFLGAGHVRDARRAAQLYPQKLFDFRAMSLGERKRRSKDYRDFMENMILQPLTAAQNADRGNVALAVELAHWRRLHWNDFHTDPKLLDRTLRDIQAAQALDPSGIDPLLTELRLRFSYSRLRRMMGSLPDDQDAQYRAQVDEHLRAADDLIARIAQRAPALESRLRFRLAQAMLNAKDPILQDRAMEQAARIADLEQAEQLPWKLRPEQRMELEKWLRVGE